jgi:hypothetical protein
MNVPAVYHAHINNEYHHSSLDIIEKRRNGICHSDYSFVLFPMRKLDNKKREVNMAYIDIK